MPKARTSDTVMVVGPGPRFLSGISYHSAALARHFAAAVPASAVFMDKLCPRWLYPGRGRIGCLDVTELGLGDLPFVLGLDWHLGRTLGLVRRFLARRRPRVVLLQWWTIAATHTSLILAILCRIYGSRLVVEFHETNDPSEAQIPGVTLTTRLAMGLMARLASGAVVHSSHDAERLTSAFRGFARHPVAVIPLGPSEHAPPTGPIRPAHAADRPIRFLFFGLLRDYKGLEDLAAAFSELCARRSDVELRVVGEPWDDSWEDIQQLATRLPDRVTISAGYVPDDAVSAEFAAADVVVLPYRRAAGSGTVHLAMQFGLPIVISSQPTLLEAVGAYGGVEVCRPEDATSLAAAMERATTRAGSTYPSAHSWGDTVAQYLGFFEHVLVDDQAREADVSLVSGMRADGDRLLVELESS